MFQRKIFVKQHDFTDCGAACLTSVAAYHKIKVTVAEVRNLAGTDKLGTNIKGLLFASSKIGFQSKGAKGTIEQVKSIPLPAILHVVLETGLHHYIVLYKVRKNAVEYMDPIDGRMHTTSHKALNEIWSGVLILLLPDPTILFQSKHQPKFIRLMKLLQPFSKQMIIILLGSLIYTFLGFSTALYVQKLVDQIIIFGNMRLLHLTSTMMVVLLIFQTFFGIFRSLLGTQTAQLIDSSLVGSYYRHLMYMPQYFFSSMRTGELISRINDAFKIRVFINDITISMFVNLAILVSTSVIMFFYSWKLIVLVAFLFPIYGCIYIVSNYLNKKYQRKLMEQSATLESDLVESIDASITIKQFSLEGLFINKINTRLGSLMRTIYISSKQSLNLNATADFFSKLFNILLLWLGAYLVIQRELTIGELLSFYALMGYLTPPILALISANKGIQEALIAADRLFEIMDIDNELTVNRSVSSVRQTISNITFTNVQFQYGMRRTIFENLSFSVEEGTTTAIIGESGSGKTTIVSLLHKLYTINSGAININGIDISHWDSHTLRSRIAIVPQKIDLFAGSIVENITVGEETPDIEKVIFLSKITGIDSFVEKLPDNYYTQINEQGKDLSGGQRQRLAIVRALYRDPDVLVLDEATSNLDINSESKIQNALSWFKQKNKTIIIIAHRLSTIESADKIMILDKGSIIAVGKHETLLEESPYYQMLWSRNSFNF